MQHQLLPCGLVYLFHAAADERLTQLVREKV